jgi:SAM-dependent methyltransferase
MSYALLSLHTGSDHDIAQWDARSIEGELRSFENRTLSMAFEECLREPGARILEGGCGFGAWCEWLERRGHQVIGVEYDERVIRRAKGFNPDAPVQLGNVLELPYPDGSFDAYVSLGVVEHFRDGPVPALREGRRILRPGGLAFITTPYLNVLRRLFSHPARSLYFAAQRLRGRRGHFWEYRFTRRELESYLRAAGFEVVETRVDDYRRSEKTRHIGLWADWPVLRKRGGEIWELNAFGRAALAVLKLFPASLYCSGILVVARAPTN